MLVLVPMLVAWPLVLVRLLRQVEVKPDLRCGHREVRESPPQGRGQEGQGRQDLALEPEFPSLLVLVVVLLVVDRRRHLREEVVRLRVGLECQLVLAPSSRTPGRDVADVGTPTRVDDKMTPTRVADDRRDLNLPLEGPKA